jgi:hypothetical protein
MLAEKNRVSWPRIVFESMKHVLFTPSSDPYFQKKKNWFKAAVRGVAYFIHCLLLSLVTC